MVAQQLVRDLLSESDQLQRAGQAQEAIEILSAANRADPQPAVEARLVELRAHAFDTLDRQHGHAEWPRPCPDPFPEVVGTPPEIHRRDLTPDIVAGGLLHHGSLIVRELVGPDDVTALQDAIRHAFEARAAYAAGSATEDDAGWYTPYEQGRHHEVFGSARMVRIIDSPRTLFLLIETYRAVGLIEVLQEHLGERPALSAHKCALRRLTPEPDEASRDYHQDGSFMGADLRTVNVWLPLMDCGGDARTAGLDLVPRRVDHILDTGVEGAIFDWTISESVVARAAEGVGIVRPSFAAGDAMLFDELMVHRTGITPGMDQERMAVESWFFAPSAYPDDHVPLVV